MTAKKIYVAGPNGFTDAGKAWHESVVLPAVAAAGFDALDPWSGPADGWFAEAFAVADLAERIDAVAAVNERVGQSNADLIDQCHAVLANLEGPDVDSGTAAEIGYAAAKGKLVVGFRPDLRTSGDNIGSVVNLQVEHFIHASGGVIGRSLEDALTAISRGVH